MIATLILFNIYTALGAFFGVCHDPGNVFALCAVLLIPPSHVRARGRLVSFVTASKTKNKWATRATNVEDAASGVLYGKLTPGAGAPLALRL